MSIQRWVAISVIAVHIVGAAVLCFYIQRAMTGITLKGDSFDLVAALQAGAVELFIDGLEAAAEANASRHPRPTEGPCKGERVESPDQCLINIVSVMAQGDAAAAASTIRGRVAGRSQQDSRVYSVFDRVLKRARKEGISLQSEVVAAAHDDLVAGLDSAACKMAVGTSVVLHFLHLDDRQRALEAFHRITVSPTEKMEDCLTSSQMIAVFDYALTGAQLPTDDYGLAHAALFVLIFTADVPDGSVPVAAIEAMFLAKHRSDDLATLKVLEDTVADIENRAHPEVRSYLAELQQYFALREAKR